MTEESCRADWFFEGKIDSSDVEVRLAGDELRLAFANGPAKTIDLRRASVSSYITGVPLKITVAGEGVLSIPDGPLAQRIAQRSMPVGASVERRPLAWTPALLGAAVLVPILLVFIVVPGIAGRMAHSMSAEDINKLTPDILESDLDFHSGGWEHEVAENTIRTIGWDLTAPIAEGYAFRFLLERSDGHVNAFALPDGTIVFGYALYEELSEKEIAGVLAHEIARVTRRHGLEAFFASTVWSIGAFVLPDSMFADPELELADMAEMSYSRDAEHDADCEAAAILARAGYQADATVATLVRMQELEHLENDGEDIEIGIMDSHPDWASRIRHARDCVANVR